MAGETAEIPAMIDAETTESLRTRIHDARIRTDAKIRISASYCNRFAR